MIKIFNRTYIVFILLYIFFFLFYQVNSIKKFLKNYNTNFNNFEVIYRRPSSILLELNELMKNSENFKGRLFIYPEDFDPETRSLDNIIQYNFMEYDYTLIKSKSINDGIKKFNNAYVIFHKLKKFPKNFNHRIINESKNYQLWEILP